MPDGTNLNRPKPTAQDLIKLYWDFYSFHSDQRIKVFNYFFTIEALLFGAYAAATSPFTSAGTENLFKSILITTAICAVAVVCFLLDLRAARLLSASIRAMKKFEETCEADLPAEMQLCSSLQSSPVRPKLSLLYRLCYALVFAAGLALMIISIFVG